MAGLQARNRQNYAQDVQISVRGFGARSTFGIRGVRLCVDGIPATLPDGQGQLSAETFSTHKTVDQTQLGLVTERRVGDEARLQLMVYGGQRNTEQFQTIPVTTQANPLRPGGVIQLARSYRDADLRGTWAATARRPLSVVAGLACDSLHQHRVGRQNCVGATLGIEGALRRDEDNRARRLDPCLQIGWQITPRLNLNAGLRHSSIRFESADHCIVGSNHDDSSAVRYAATLPVLGLVYALNPDVRICTSAGRGFETPTLNELACRSDGSTGLNLRLKPAKSDNAEVGHKMRSRSLGEPRMAWFGGRSSFTDAGTSQRQGLEASWALALAGDLEFRATYTLANARYRDAFAICTVTPCAAANFTVAAGNRIPGIARSTGEASLAWARDRQRRPRTHLRTRTRTHLDGRRQRRRQVPASQRDPSRACVHEAAHSRQGCAQRKQPGHQSLQVEFLERKFWCGWQESKPRPLGSQTDFRDHTGHRAEGWRR